MPPGEKKVPSEQIALIERWIAGGAAATRKEPERLDPGIDMTPEERAYWAFQPSAGRCRRRLHRTIGSGRQLMRSSLAKLRERGLALAPDADKRALIRRAAFDLTGLPPSQEDIDAFLADSTDSALRADARPAHGLASVRRALGPTLARRGRLCRLGW